MSWDLAAFYPTRNPWAFDAWSEEAREAAAKARKAKAGHGGTQLHPVHEEGAKHERYEVHHPEHGFLGHVKQVTHTPRTPISRGSPISKVGKSTTHWGSYPAPHLAKHLDYPLRSSKAQKDAIQGLLDVHRVHGHKG